MLARQTISALVFSILICAVDSNAAVYKWRDENGKIHFTDDPTRVPEEFHKPFLKSFKTPAKKIIPKEESVSKKGNAISGEKDTSENEKKESAEQIGLTEEQRSIAEAIMSFLETDILRYDKYYNYPPSRSKFRSIKSAVKQATPQKQALLNQISNIDLPLFKEIAGFLEASITADEKAQKVMPTTLPSARQTIALMTRLKSDTQREKQLLEKLNEELNSAE